MLVLGTARRNDLDRAPLCAAAEELYCSRGIHVFDCDAFRLVADFQWQRDLRRGFERIRGKAEMRGRERLALRAERSDIAILRADSGRARHMRSKSVRVIV